MPSINNVWSSTSPEGEAVSITTPAGQTCQAIRLGLPGIIETGILGEADQLTAIVDRQHVKRVRSGNNVVEKIDPASLLKDPDSLARVVKLVDDACPHIVVEPVVKLHYTTDEDGKTHKIPLDRREDDVVYTDQIPFEDKMFLFNWAVGGSANLEQFREATGLPVADVADVADVPRAAKRAAARSRKK